MNNGWTGEVWRLFWLLLGAVVAGYVLGYPWQVLSLAMLSYLLWLLHGLHRLNRWIEKGLKRSQAPVVSGLMENIVTNIYQLKTSRKQGKKQLARMAKQFRNSIEAIPDATVILTTNGEIQWFNEAAGNLLGLQSPRDIGQRIDNLVRDPRFRKFLHGRKHNDELRLVALHNSALILSCRLIKYGKGNLLLTVRDISIRERADLARREFVSNASHELRTPLTVIRGYVEMLSTDDECPETVREKLEMIRQQAQQMDHILAEMLTLSRLENTMLEVEEGERVDVPAILRRLEKEAVGAGRADAGQIHVEVDESLCLRGIDKEISSCVSNLLYNALSHNPKGTRVDLQWLRNAAGEPCLTVSDEGIGIEPQHIGRLSERFYRVDSSRSRESGGTGLGLAIVKHIVQRHGGRLDIVSTPGSGSTFRCCFNTARAIVCE